MQRQRGERALLVEAQHERLLLGGGPHLLARDAPQLRMLLLDPLGEPEAARIEHVLGLGDREHDAQHGLGKAALLLARLDRLDLGLEQLLGVLVAGARLAGVGIAAPAGRRAPRPSGEL